jgi:2-keto-4-pentenoate hydratase/2-oxohepta-3-ene-1,7-dioic acid hydratase in catechol pathway
MRQVPFADTLITPSKVVCIGRNYVAHIKELGNEVPDEMVVFCKPNSAIGRELRAEHDGEALHYEGEIALLVSGGRIAGAGFGLDLTKRRLQSRLKEQGLPWERAKAFDGAALFSPFQPLSGDAAGLALELDVDGEARQRGDASLMLYPPAVILAELRRFMSLEDGDIIMTGTPAGVGKLHPGERFHGRVLQRGDLLVQQEWQVV